jgi:hypothetical protein
MITACPHAYKIKTGLVTICFDCKQIVETNPNESYVPIEMPPESYKITEGLWKRIAPWPLIPFEQVKKYGWYLSFIKSAEYLIMPCFREGKPVFYSARKIGNGFGPKYNYQVGAKKYHWISEDKLKNPIFIGEGVADGVYLNGLGSSIALLGSYYDGSLDPQILNKDIYLVLDGDVPGIVASASIAQQLAGVARSTYIAILPNGVDPTDLPLPELRRFCGLS